MTARFDHTAEALSTLEEIGYPESNEGCIAHAQVHATLALVEQQRIANLLTMAQFDHAIEDGMRLYTGLEWSAKLRQEAGERLGLS